MPVIPKEKSGAYKVWKIDSFDQKPGGNKPSKKPPPATPNTVKSPSVNGVAMPTAESVERIHDEARREGLESGKKEGYAAGITAARQEATRLATLVNNFQNAIATIEHDLADAVLELALAIARQVVQEQLEIHPESIVSVIRGALTSLPLHHGNINIHLHPDDARLLREQLGNQVAQSGWHLIDDSTVTRGGIVIRAGSSEIDGTFETRWRRVLDALGKPPADPA
ncbi:MAG: flagellar assembly protein FliH [Proteobacteria bacterium]|nr:flagellar assembly protein FliH [Pseudomonadota bacterium]